MQKQIDIEVSARAERGKNAARRLRASGRVPAIVYGLDREPESVALDTKALTSVLSDPSGRNRVFRWGNGEGEQHAMAVDYQIDPVHRSLLHVDLRRVDLDKPVRASVPVASEGVALGVRNEGGFEEMVSREVRIECLPLEIPERIDLAVEDLHVGQSLRVRDLPESDRYALVDDEHKLLVHIMASRASDDEAAETDEEEEPQIEE